MMFNIPTNMTITLPVTSTGRLPMANAYYLDMFASNGCASVTSNSASITARFSANEVPGTITP
jgi:hypothetical protein